MNLQDRITRKLAEAGGIDDDRNRIIADEIIAMVLNRDKIGHAVCMERRDGRPWDEEQGREIADRVIGDLKA